MTSIRSTQSILTEKYREELYKIYLNRNVFHYNILRKMLGRRLILIVGSAHKVGSSWLYNLLRDTYRFSVLVLPKTFTKSVPTRQVVDIDISELLEYLAKLNGFFIFKSHSLPISYSLPPDVARTVKFVTIVRDPRDVIVSASFYLANLDIRYGGLGEKFAELNEVDRVLGVIREGGFLISGLEKWYENPFAHKVRYENLQNNPIDELRRVGDYLKLRFKAKTAKRAIHKNSFQKLSGREPGHEKKDEFLRKGITGDWKNYFDEDCISAFKTAKDGRWNRLLIKMGYEQNLNW